MYTSMNTYINIDKYPFTHTLTHMHIPNVVISKMVAYLLQKKSVPLNSETANFLGNIQTNYLLTFANTHFQSFNCPFTLSLFFFFFFSLSTVLFTFFLLTPHALRSTSCIPAPQKDVFFSNCLLPTAVNHDSFHWCQHRDAVLMHQISTKVPFLFLSPLLF